MLEKRVAEKCSTEMLDKAAVRGFGRECLKKGWRIVMYRSVGIGCCKECCRDVMEQSV